MLWTLHCTEEYSNNNNINYKVLNVSFLARRGGAREGGLGNSSTGGWCLLAWDRILRAELGKVSSKCSRELAALETLGELLAG